MANNLFMELMTATTLEIMTSSLVALPVALWPSLSEITTKVSASASVPPLTQLDQPQSERFP